MKHICDFQIGEVVSNRDIASEFECAIMGGMRRSKAKNALILINDHTKGLYEDKWYGDVLHYTGMGQTGDQGLHSAQNKTLALSNENGVSVHLFEVLIPTEYIYRGEVLLIDEPYEEKQKDVEGNSRKVWMFPVQLQKSSQEIPEKVLADYTERKRREAKKISLKVLEERAKEKQSENVSRREMSSTVYIRDEFVAEFAKRRANGICQLCEQAAPFITKTGGPYLECHHIDWLSNGGSDTIKNTVALCANCHRKMHSLNLPDDVEKLREVALKDILD